MKRLRKKLHSERGASILLALLMLLVCMMVGASVLAAAASNAGKIRSNRVEQQRYLTLSSAIRLVADELQKARYTGKYKVWTWDVTTVTVDNSDPDNPTETRQTESFFFCAQTPGAYECGDLTAQLPLEKELNEIFSQKFREKLSGGYRGLPEGHAEMEDSVPRTLTVTLPGDLEGYPYEGSGPKAYQIPEEVTVEVKLDHSTKHITLTAWLGTDPLPDAAPGTVPGTPPEKDKTSALIAELVVKEGTAPVIDDTLSSGRKAGTWNEDTSQPDIPSSTTDPAENPRIEVTVIKDGTEETSTDPKTQWELNWVKKGASQ